MAAFVRGQPAPHNQRPGLIPSSGGWRGSTLGAGSLVHDGPDEYKAVYGHDLHIWRSFKTATKASITGNEREFVRNGGILWYNIQPHNWSEASSPSFGPTIRMFARHVKSLAPAQVIVNAGHEPDRHCDRTNKHNPYYGSPSEYQAMWMAFRAGFSSAGAHNAVWAMDYSRAMRKSKIFEQFAAALWPGDSNIDWLFFNAFGDHPMGDKQGRGNFTEIVNDIYSQFQSGVGAGHNYTAVPWGLGAFQPKPAPLMEPQDRIQFLSQAESALRSSLFPRLRALVYYDSDAGAMKPAEYLSAYTQYLSSPFFTANDPMGLTTE